MKSSWKILLFSALALGLGIEIFKYLADGSSHQHNSTPTHYEELVESDTQAVNTKISQQTAKARRFQNRARSTQNSPDQQEITLNGPPSRSQKAEVEDSEDSDKEKSEDSEKDDDKEDEEESKKDSEDSTEKQNDENEQVAEDDEQEEENDEERSEFIGGPLAPVGPEQPGQDSVGQRTLDDWLALMLRSPNLELTQQFTKLYQSEIISSDIFYPVVTEMLADSRYRMRELGAQALGATPSLRSFVELAYVDVEENVGSPIHRQLEAYFAAYTEIQNLGLLSQALSGDYEAVVKVKAANLVQDAAQRHLVATQVGEDGRERSQRISGDETVVANAERFITFVTVLRELLDSDDSGVRQTSSVALQTIENLLNPRI